MESLIEQNIYAFYDAIGKSMENGFFKSNKTSWLNSGTGNWPNMIYNSHFEENHLNSFVSENVSAIKSKKAPPFWLVYNDKIGNQLADRLKNEGMREIFNWAGMGLKIDTPFEIKLENSVQIKKVTSDLDLNNWISILNSALMTSNKVDSTIFKDLYNKSNFSLYIVSKNNVPVATGLSFFDNNYCGIYMVATLENYRKKGLGSAITKHCINAAHQKGITNIVLHASQKGVSIYEKMGFKKYCEFSIYWMLGKEFK